MSKEILMGISLIFSIGVIVGFMYVMGYALQQDLKEMEKTHPKFRKYLKNKYKL